MVHYSSWFILTVLVQVGARMRLTTPQSRTNKENIMMGPCGAPETAETLAAKTPKMTYRIPDNNPTEITANLKGTIGGYQLKLSVLHYEANKTNITFPPQVKRSVPVDTRDYDLEEGDAGEMAFNMSWNGASVCRADVLGCALHAAWFPIRISTTGVCTNETDVPQMEGLLVLEEYPTTPSVPVTDPKEQLECFALCKKAPGATGCTMNNTGCYAYTKPVSKTKNEADHICWIFNLPAYHSCSDIRILSQANDLIVTMTATTTTAGDLIPVPKTILNRILNAFKDVGLTEENVFLEPKDILEFETTSERNFVINLKVIDTIMNTSDAVVRFLDKSLRDQELKQSLGVEVTSIKSASALFTEPEPKKGAGGAIVIILLLLAVIGAAVYIKLKKPELIEDLKCFEKSKGVDL